MTTDIVDDKKYYKSLRIIDGKPRLVIVDENGNIINRYPNKKELNNLEFEYYKHHSKIYYDNEELLDYLRQFFEENGRIPVARDFENNPKYPTINTFIKRFGSWNNALKLAGLYIDAITIENLATTNQKGRYWENIVREIFKDKDKSIDLSGENWSSYCDGICPNGQAYEAKSAGLIPKAGWNFHFKFRYLEVKWFYLGAFTKDYKKLLYAWRIPSDAITENNFYVGKSYGKFNIYNLKKYDITDTIKKILYEKGIII